MNQKFEEGDIVECIDDSVSPGHAKHSGLINDRKYVVYNVDKVCCNISLDIGLIVSEKASCCATCKKIIASRGDTYWTRASRFRKIEPEYKLVEFDFHEGKQVSEADIARWHKDALDFLERDKEAARYSVRSGNGMLIAERDIENGEITMYEVTKGYKWFKYANPK